MSEHKHKPDSYIIQLEKLYDNIPEACFLVNKEARIIFSNAIALKQLGYKKNEITKLYLDDISENYIGISFEELWETIKKRGTYGFESRHITKLGKIVPVQVKVNFFSFDNNEYISCIASDISNLKLVEKSYLESNTLFEAVFNTIPDPIGILDDKYGAIKYNQAALDVLKIEDVNYKGKKCYELINNVIPCEICSVRQVYEKRKIASKEVYLDKLEKWVDVRAYPILDENGNVLKVIEHLRDITEQKNVEEKLRISEERYRSLIENSNELILIFQNNKICFANSAATSFFGVGIPEIYKTDVLSLVHPHDQKKVAKQLQSLQQGQKPPQSFETRILTNDGTVKHLDIRSTLIEYEGEPAYLVTARDVTKRREAEEKFYQTFIELEKSEKEKSLSHYVLDNASELIYLIDIEGNIFKANEMACKVAGLSYKELRNKQIFDIYIQFDKQNWKKTWKELKVKDDILQENIHRNQKGKMTHVEIDINLIKYDNSDYALIFSRDITIRKEAEKKINEHLNEIERLKNRLEAENLYLMDEIKLSHNFEEIITKSSKFKRVLSNVEKVASTDSTVLITGETGTGKELLARAIHNISQRKDRPLVKVNCAALPAELIESELFGYEQGAFTGALTQKIGRFELANGGTIFLDEIGELPLALQPKLLRVLQDGEFERLGNPNSIKVDVRVIAATNRNLNKAIDEKKFRPDLFYRLNVFPIHNPTLREKKEDIPLLVNHFILKFANKHNKFIKSIPQKVMTEMKNYSWPGNVRELENIIERAVIISPEEELVIGDWLKSENQTIHNKVPQKLEEVEREHILSILNTTGWRIRGARGAAELLGVKPTTLEAKMKKIGIERP